MTIYSNREHKEVAESEVVPQEIERKFIIATVPDDLQTYPHQSIRQGYLFIGEDGAETRVRQRGDLCYKTEKAGTGRERAEKEVEISQELFDELWEQTGDRRIFKERYEIPRGDNTTIECDVYGGELRGLVVAEVEFPSVAASNTFTPPPWFGLEVTDNNAYKNQSLATEGLPREVNRDSEIEHTSTPEFDLREGIDQVIQRIRAQMQGADGPVICAVAGGSASGKTSEVTDKLCNTFHEQATRISIDDYYRGKTYMDEQANNGNILNWDQPEALDLELLMHHIEQLKRGEKIVKPLYSMKTGEPCGTEIIDPNSVIIIEGLFALDDVLKDVSDVKAFVDIGTHGRIVRRLLRDVTRTGQNPADILRYFAEVVEPMHEKYVQSTRTNADIIIHNEYSPSVEAGRSGLSEIQMKFTTVPDADMLRRIGAERLARVSQTDYYYNPKDRDLVDTDEMVRIRDEGDRHILTYKGPRDAQSEYRKRPKFEFEIDDQTKDSFLGIYGEMVKKISKERTLYQLNGVTFSIDHVYSEDGGDRTELGTFLEVRGTTTDDERAMESVIEKLGLKRTDAIAESYFELDKELK